MAASTKSPDSLKCLDWLFCAVSALKMVKFRSVGVGLAPVRATSTSDPAEFWAQSPELFVEFTVELPDASVAVKATPPFPATNLLNVEKTVPVAPVAFSPARAIFEIVPFEATCQIPAELLAATAPNPILRYPANVIRRASSSIGSPIPEKTAPSGALRPIPAARLVVPLIVVQVPPRIFEPETP